MSYKKHMLERPHPLAGILVWIPFSDITFNAIDWIREPANAVDTSNQRPQPQTHQRIKPAMRKTKHSPQFRQQRRHQRAGRPTRSAAVRQANTGR